MRKNKKSTLLGIFLVCISLVSCDTSLFDFDSFAGTENWDPTISTPLLHAKVSIANLIENPTDESFSFTTAEDGTLYFKYLQKNIVDFNLGDEFAFPERVDARSRKVVVPFPSGVVSPTDAELVAIGALPFSQVIDVDFNSTDTDEIEIYKSFLDKLGLEVLIASNEVSFDGWMKITLGKSLVGSDPLTFELNIKDGMGQLDRSYTNVVLDFISANRGNKLTIDGFIEMDHINSTRTDLRGVDFTMQLAFKDMVHRKVEADLGYAQKRLPKKKVNITSSFWSRVEGDAMAFIIDEQVPAFMKLYYRNGFGSPFQISSMLSVYFDGKDPMDTDEINSYIKSPASSEDGALEDSYDYISDSGTNLGSNLLKSIFISQPFEAIEISGDYRANMTPRLNRVSPSNPNFILPNSKLNCDLELKLPFYFRTAKTAILDTIGFESSYNFDRLHKLKLIGRYENSIPMSLQLELIPYDKENDQVFTHQITNEEGKQEDATVKIILGKLKIPEIDSESLDPTHRQSSSTKGALECELDQDQIDAIKNADSFIVRTVFDTKRSDGTKLLNVVVHSEDYLDLNLGICSVVSVKSGDL